MYALQKQAYGLRDVMFQIFKMNLILRIIVLYNCNMGYNYLPTGQPYMILEYFKDIKDYFGNYLESYLEKT